MENKAHALAAGIFVALMTVLVLGLAAWLTRDTGARDPYEISTKETVTGLAEQAPVRFRGVDVGKVKSIGFDPKALGNVLIRIEVDRDTPLTRETYATLSYQGVTGLAFIQLADEGHTSVRLQPNDEVPPRIPLRPGLLARLEERGEVILQNVEKVTERVNAVLGPDNQKRIADALENISRAATNTQQLTTNINTTLTRRLDPALDQVTVTLKGAQRTVDQIGAAAGQVGKTAEQIGKTADQFGATAQRLNAPGGAMERLSQGTEALANAAESFSVTTLPRINRAADEATRTVRTLNRAINDLTENPQMLIYGEGQQQPGPGEPGFAAQGARR